MEEVKAKTPLEKGHELTIEYCLACHEFDESDQPGTVGPVLLVIELGFPLQKLEAIMYDPQVAIKPDTMMPPFGRNEVLDQQQIKLIIGIVRK